MAMSPRAPVTGRTPGSLTVCCVSVSVSVTVLLMLRLAGEGVSECVLVGVEEDALGVVVAGAAVRLEGEDVLADSLV